MAILSDYHHLEFGTKVLVNFMNENVKGEYPGQIVAVHFHPGKVRYDVEIETYKLDDQEGEGTTRQFVTRLYNVEAKFISNA